MKINRLYMPVLSAIFCTLMLGISVSSSAGESVKNARSGSASTSALTAPININTASIEMLAVLNGIGEKKASDIIAYREANGKFSKVEDLLNVKGIGEKTLEKNRSLLSVN